MIAERQTLASGFMMDAGMRLADKQGKLHRRNDGPEAGASNTKNSPSFHAARHIGFPSVSGETVPMCGAAAAGRVLSRTTERRHECQ